MNWERVSPVTNHSTNHIRSDSVSICHQGNSFYCRLPNSRSSIEKKTHSENANNLELFDLQQQEEGQSLAIAISGGDGSMKW